MLSDLNFETNFGILSSFYNFLTSIHKDLHILIFWPPKVISKYQSHGGWVKTHIFGKTNFTTLVSEKNRTRIGGHTWRN